ncbi:MAG: hypothetical protein LIP08_13025 [Bacteroides sp.]|nr:hypothetical protein [Bacteroides sp.]
MEKKQKNNMEKKETLKVKDIVRFNEVFKDVKVSGLNKEATVEYLNLKICISELVEKFAEREKKIFKEAIPEGYKEGDKLPPEKYQEFKSLIDGLMEKFHNEPIKEEIDTHVLSLDELFDSVLNIEENKNISSEGKALLMKYLKK